MKFRYRLPAALLSAAAGVLALQSAGPWAQEPVYPNRPLRYVVPMPPGGPNDFLGRVVAERLSKSLGQPVVVENRPGADSLVGTEYVVRQAADGHYLIHVAASHVTNASFKAKLPYDPIRDFEPVTQLAGMKFILAATPALGVTSVKEFVERARAHPGKITYATLGVGSSHFLAGELLRLTADINIVHVPYKGGAQITQALLAQEVDATFISVFPVRPHIRSGKLRGLGVTTATRSAALPEVPTIAEAGPYPGYEMDVWQGVLVRTGTPRPVIARLNRELVTLLKTAENAAKISAAGLDPVGSTPEQFMELMKKDLAKWARVAKEAGIKPE
ncbi:MAG: tripartite tricarboxylate transporter substrate binding protein [Burkholderiales bacterium]|nr:tripartite tricarboxylate transporter substrate binding protein [Burkholderiales bacterium]